jgi:hypothetical protein
MRVILVDGDGNYVSETEKGDGDTLATPAGLWPVTADITGAGKLAIAGMSTAKFTTIVDENPLP